MEAYLILPLLIKLCCTLNLIQNYSFESAVVPVAVEYIVQSATGWTGHFYDIIRTGNGMTFGQFIDLQRGEGENGYIQQTVNLKNAGACQLNFYYRPLDNNFASYKINVIWNGVVVTTKIASIVQLTLQTLQLPGRVGSNTLRFQEIGTSLPGDYTGMYIDEVILQCPLQNVNQTKTQNISAFQKITHAFALIFSLPLQQVICVRYAYLFVEDVWMYYYNNVSYSQPLVIVFYIVVVIQQIKFEVFDQLLGWSKYQANLPLSNYKPYTSQKFAQIEGSSYIPLQSSFSFFIYVLPMNILAGAILYFLFKEFSNYKVSVFIRKFYFFKETLVEVLIQGNIIYFTYICLGHLSFPWSYKFLDKMFLVHTILLFFFTIFFTLTFFFLVSRFLGKKSSYFIYCFYRMKQSYVYLTIKKLRQLWRGFVFFYLQNLYERQIILLTIVQVAVITSCICLQCTRQMYTSKQFFCLELLYHLLFALLNLCLYFEYWSNVIAKSNELKKIAVDSQQVLLYFLISIALLTIFLDVVPISSLKKCCRKLKLFKKSKKKSTKRKLKTINPRKQEKKRKLESKKINKVNQKPEIQKPQKKKEAKVVKFQVKLTKVNTKKNQQVKKTFVFQKVCQKMELKDFVL